jgi:hypothetical protein
MNNILFLVSVYEQLFLDYIDLNKDVLGDCFGVAYGKNKKTISASYKKVLFYSDHLSQIPSISEDEILALQKIEAICGVSLADCIHSDRHLMKIKPENRKHIAYRMLLDSIDLISKYNINYIFAEGADDFISFALSKYFDQSRKVNFLYAIPSRLGSKFHFSDNINNAPIGYSRRFFENFKNKKFASTDIFINDYIENKSQPFYLKSNLIYKTYTMEQLRSFCKYVFRYLTEINSMHIQESPIHLLRIKAMKIVRKTLYEKIPKIDNSNLPKNFLIFPLQFSPEASTLIQGSKFNDMYQVIELISKSLPVNFTLLVKEHKLCVGRRDYQFFKKILNLHNVKLIKEDVDTYQLISHSKGVITVSSSMAIEALMLKKPVGIIGRMYFDNLSNVHTLHNLYSLDHDIKEMLASDHNSDELSALIQTIIECGFEVDMHPETYSGLENLPNIPKYISKYS